MLRVVNEQVGGSQLSEFLAKCLCYGVRPTPEVLTHWGNISRLRPGFIHGVPLLVADRHRLNTSIVDSMSSGKLAQSVFLEHGTTGTIVGSDFIKVEPVPQPACCVHGSTADRAIGDYFLLHSPSTLFSTPVRQCVFGEMGQGCKFCTFQMLRPEPISLDLFIGMLSNVLDETGTIPSLAIGGGTPNIDDFGAKYYAELASAARSRGFSSISVELVPPLLDQSLELLFDAGVTSVIMSLELWNDRARKAICPGKAVVPKTRYFSSWETCLERLGPGSVSSVLIFGIETAAETCQGINELVGVGVLPTIIPFRPYDGISLRRPPPSHLEFLEVAKYCAGSLVRAGLSVRSRGGCAECGGCSLEGFLSESPLAASPGMPRRAKGF